jgi:hypothetical protein
MTTVAVPLAGARGLGGRTGRAGGFSGVGMNSHRATGPPAGAAAAPPTVTGSTAAAASTDTTAATTRRETMRRTLAPHHVSRRARYALAQATPSWAIWIEHAMAAGPAGPAVTGIDADPVIAAPDNGR